MVKIKFVVKIVKKDVAFLTNGSDDNKKLFFNGRPMICCPARKKKYILLKMTIEIFIFKRKRFGVGR